ncbi:MAG: enoyl-CoA hydratase/isomerase family protein [Myxococcota bacterium]|nr:enoyl-CoA hydratase/isomerase family protein [Myxococcota bacterium]
MAEPIEYEKRQGVGWLHMDDGKVNAIQGAWLDAMQAGLDRAEEDDVHAVVITGRPDVFSAGLDLKVIPGLPLQEMKEVTDRFVETMRRLFLFPKPLVAAAEGHALAGGMMTMLAADLRLAAAGKASRYGLNEAITGVPLAGGTLGICRYSIPQAHHTELLLHGRAIDAEEALSRNIFHEVVPASELLDRAMNRATELADLALDIYPIHKRMLRSAAFDQAIADARAVRDQLPDRNFFSGLDR